MLRAPIEYRSWWVHDQHFGSERHLSLELAKDYCQALAAVKEREGIDSDHWVEEVAPNEAPLTFIPKRKDR